MSMKGNCAMLIALFGTNIDYCRTVATFLEGRGFIRVETSPKSPLHTLDINPNEHHILIGANPADYHHLKQKMAAALIFVGAPPADDHSALQKLHQAADHHLSIESGETGIVSCITDALSTRPRPDWDQYFIDIAKVVATRGNCMKRQVAAVLVKDRRVVATGYNGTPRGAKNCNEGGCERCNSLVPSGTALDDCVCNHAEENAICQAAYHGISIKDATLYCTHSPCLRCAKLLINAGVKEVVYNADYPMSTRSKSLLDECTVICRRYP